VSHFLYLSISCPFQSVFYCRPCCIVVHDLSIMLMSSAVGAPPEWWRRWPHRAVKQYISYPCTQTYITVWGSEYLVSSVSRLCTSVESSVYSKILPIRSLVWVGVLEYVHPQSACASKSLCMYVEVMSEFLCSLECLCSHLYFVCFDRLVSGRHSAHIVRHSVCVYTTAFSCCLHFVLSSLSSFSLFLLSIM